MYNFNKKQKIVLVILAIAVILGICYYVYAKDGNFSSMEELQVEESLQENLEEAKEINKENEETIVVHISGAVEQEGIVELKVNSRVADAIEKAGGLKDDANTNDINLAYVLEDGMKIYIPNKQETEEKQTITKKSGVIEENTAQETTQKTSQTTVNKTNSNTKKVNINTALQTELETLPGIGPSIATKIITYRKENGGFKTIKDIKEVSGIGESKFNNIKDLITVK